MRKADIANEIYKQVGISKKAADIVELVLNMLKAVLQRRFRQDCRLRQLCRQKQRCQERPEPTNR